MSPLPLPSSAELDEDTEFCGSCCLKEQALKPMSLSEEHKRQGGLIQRALMLLQTVGMLSLLEAH